MTITLHGTYLSYCPQSANQRRPDFGGDAGGGEIEGEAGLLVGGRIGRRGRWKRPGSEEQPLPFPLGGKPDPLDLGGEPIGGGCQPRGRQPLYRPPGGGPPDE